jgi:integrase
MSIRKRTLPSGKGVWQYDYRDQTGARRRKQFATKREASNFETTARHQVREGTHVAESATVTVAEAGRKWLASAEHHGLERTTIDQYRQHLVYHIEPFIGNLKLNKLNIPLIRDFQEALRTKPYPPDYPKAALRGKVRSAAIVKRVTVSLGSLLADAQERGLTATNPARELRGRRKRKGEHRQRRRLEVGVDIPTPAETRAVVEAAHGRYRPLLITAIFTGLRASELRGLRWQDVDLKAKCLHVRQRADKYHAIGLPKSDAGQRRIPFPPMVASTLTEWRVQCPKGDLDLVFPNGKGNVEWYPNIIKRGLQPTLIRAGVVDADGKPKYTGFHAIRHFYASWCINSQKDGGQGLSPKAVQERMGHSSIAVTMDTYGHLFPATDEGETLAAAELALIG